MFKDIQDISIYPSMIFGQRLWASGWSISWVASRRNRWKSTGNHGAMDPEYIKYINIKLIIIIIIIIIIIFIIYIYIWLYMYVHYIYIHICMYVDMCIYREKSCKCSKLFHSKGTTTRVYARYTYSGVYKHNWGAQHCVSCEQWYAHLKSSAIWG